MEKAEKSTNEMADGQTVLHGQFRNRIIYSHDGAILRQTIVKSEASLMDLKVLDILRGRTAMRVDCFGIRLEIDGE